MTVRRVIRVLLISLLSLVVIFSVGKVYTDRQVRRGAEEHPPDGQFVEVNGVRMHYVVRGDGPPILLIHGMSGIYQDFAYGVVDSLERNYRCLTFDRLGSGYSERPSLDSITVGTHARYIHDAAVKLGIVKPLVVGHSYGGAVALAYALAYPDDCSGLVLLAPVAYPLHKRVELMARPLLWRGVGSFLVSTLYLPLRKLIYPFAVEHAAEPDTVPTAYIQLKQQINISPSNFLTQVHELEHLDEDVAQLVSQYHELKMPIVIIVGDSDRILPPEQQALALAKEIPDVRLVVIPGAGHLLPQCRASEVVRYIWSLAGSPAAIKQD